MTVSQDRTERLARELELGEALLRNERKDADQALTEVHRHLRAAHERLAELSAIESSVTWRIARRLRDGLRRLPRVRAVLLAMLRLAYWAVTRQLAQKLRARRRAERAAAEAARLDTRVQKFDVPAFGWLGGETFRADGLYAPTVVALAATPQVARSESNAAHALEALRTVAPTEMIREMFRNARVDPATADSSAKPIYCIITVVDAGTRVLRACAASVKTLIESQSQPDKRRVEWLIVNDDPATGPDALAAQLPEGLHASVRILHDGKRRGQVARLNEACEAAGSEWLLLLDGDDEIEPHAIAVLDRAIARFPKCRYISACAADVDANGAVLRWRRCADPTTLFEDDEAVGPLIAIRRDLFLGAGSYRGEHAPCHDYDFALRAALREPLLCIPDYLSRSRQPRESQALRQACTANVLRAFLGNLADQQFAPSSRSTERVATVELKSGFCLIRTQGRRLEFLEEAILSVLDQTVPVTPCVIVHGDDATIEKVRSDLLARKLEAVVIPAPDLGKKRGYPLNVGLAYLRQHATEQNFFLFLDDDDVLYPFFAARLVELLNLTGADVGVADANCRVPWEPATRSHNLKPASALLAGNFMPIHSFIMRTSLLGDAALRFDEEIDYLEDWDFLVSVFASDARFRFLPEALCEFRIIGDGSTPEKNRPIHFEFCRQQIFARAQAIARRMGPVRYLHDLAAFDFSERPELTPYEKEHLSKTRALFFAETTEARE